MYSQIERFRYKLFLDKEHNYLKSEDDFLGVSSSDSPMELRNYYDVNTEDGLYHFGLLIYCDFELYKNYKKEEYDEQLKIVRERVLEYLQNLIKNRNKQIKNLQKSINQEFKIELRKNKIINLK